MENILYERDYYTERQKQKEQYDDTQEMNIFYHAIETGFFQAYSDAMRSLPKIVNPIRKANFEYVEDICNRMAHRWGGIIRSEVRYDKWDAIIDLTLPFIEFGSPEDLSDMHEISQRVDSCTFSPTDNGWIRMHIFCLYFDDIATEEEIDEIVTEKIKQRPELLNALHQKMKAGGLETSNEEDQAEKFN